MRLDRRRHLQAFDRAPAAVEHGDDTGLTSRRVRFAIVFQFQECRSAPPLCPHPPPGSGTPATSPTRSSAPAADRPHTCARSTSRRAGCARQRRRIGKAPRRTQPWRGVALAEPGGSLAGVASAEPAAKVGLASPAHSAAHSAAARKPANRAEQCAVILRRIHPPQPRTRVPTEVWKAYCELFRVTFRKAQKTGLGWALR